MGQVFTSIPSPPHNMWNLGPFPIRFYAVMILTGIFTAIWFGNKRWIARGGAEGDVADVALWAVPFGVIGGRLYHVVTDWATYFGVGGRGFVSSLKIWEGGLGIWGAVALGAVGAYIGCARKGLAFAPFADAIAPALVFAQAIGRWGNWFNQELFGRPTNAPWGLHIDLAHRPAEYIQYSTFHPTFLYESIACLVIGFIVIKADSTYLMGHGRVFALYVALYCAARGGIETLRVDQAHTIFGIRLNVFTAVIVGFLALAFLLVVGERKLGREILLDGKYASPEAIALMSQDVADMSIVIDSSEVADDSHQVTAGDSVVSAPAMGDESNESSQDASITSTTSIQTSSLDPEHVPDGQNVVSASEPPPLDVQTSGRQSGASRARRAKPKGS